MQYIEVGSHRGYLIDASHCPKTLYNTFEQKAASIFPLVRNEGLLFSARSRSSGRVIHQTVHRLMHRSEPLPGNTRDAHVEYIDETW